MIPMKIDVDAVTTRLMELGLDPVPAPPLVRSLTIACPNRKWLKTDWQVYWNEYRRARNVNYFPGAGECEWFSKLAAAESYFCARSAFGGQDVAGFVIEALLTIPKGKSYLGGITDGGHSTCLIPVTDDGESFDLVFWEPQLTNHETMDVRAALRRGIVLEFVCL